jgi:flagellar hook-length control protein FliK
LLSDLLKTGMITPQEYETVLKNPEESSLPELLGELKKETGKLIEELENVDAEQNVETEQIARPRQAEQPNQTEQPKLAEQPKPVKQGRQKEEFRQVEHTRQAKGTEQAKVAKQFEPQQSKPQPWQVEVHSQVKQFLQSEQLRSIQAEQPIQSELPIQAEQAEQAEQPKQPKQPKQPEQAEQFRQIIEQPIQQPIQLELPKQTEQFEPPEPLLEELRVISTEMEMGIKPKDKAKFYELVNNLLDKGLINELDLKNVMKVPTIDKESSSPVEPISKNEKNDAEKIEPVSIGNNVLEKLWTSFESENKTEKENVFSKIKEIVELKSTSVSSEKIGIKSTKVEVEVRAVWEAGDLKIETVNPKTGEKLQSVPVANMHRMQERINEFEVVRQVVSQAKFITTPTGEQKMTMQLRPEHLGQVDLRITLNHGEMQIHARVESATVQAALESHVGLLREGLEKQGINLERLEISVEQRDRQDAFSLAERQEQQERHGKGKHRRGKETHLAISVKNDVNSDTGRRLGYNTMEYLA